MNASSTARGVKQALLCQALTDCKCGPHQPFIDNIANFPPNTHSILFALVRDMHEVVPLSLQKTLQLCVGQIGKLPP